MTYALGKKGWQKSNDVDSVPRFRYASAKIHTTLATFQGPGWEAAIEGVHEVSEIALHLQNTVTIFIITFVTAYALTA